MKKQTNLKYIQKSLNGALKQSASKKLKGNMVVTIIIFLLSFLVFSICAIDAGHVVVSRYKVQKVTETIALYMASYLNSKPAGERTKDALEPLKERFEDLYSASLSGFYNFKITDIELKNETTEPKLKISTEANIPTLFLKYAGIGVIRILQVSYAKAESSDMTMIDSDVNSYTFEANDIITDKNGDDISVKYEGDYFIFAGLKGHDDEILWSDLSYATDNVKKTFDITLGGDASFNLVCVEKGSGEAPYDFSRTDEKTIGLVKYIKIYKADCTKEITPPDALGEGEEGAEGGSVEGEEDGGAVEPPIEGSIEGETAKAETGVGAGSAETGGAGDGTEGTGGSVSAPEVKVLNSVRLIRKSQF